VRDFLTELLIGRYPGWVRCGPSEVLEKWKMSANTTGAHSFSEDNILIYGVL
jgi:hypothetical protein